LILRIILKVFVLGECQIILHPEVGFQIRYVYLGLDAWIHVGQVTLFHFEDELRENAASVVEILKEQCDLRVLMLTGDNASTAKRVAKSVGIDEFHAGLKPEDKLDQIHRLSQEKSIASKPFEILKIFHFVF